MRIDLLIPSLGESITEATVVRLNKKPGDPVKRGEAVLEISSEKVDSDVVSPVDGIVTHVFYKEQDVVKVNSKVAVIASTENKADSDEEAPASEPPQSSRYASPLLPTMAAKYGVSGSELETIPGTGPEGRLTKDDLLQYVKSKNSSSEIHDEIERSQALLSAPPERITQRSFPMIDWQGQDVKTIEMDHVRSGIAEHMIHSKRTSPHVYSVQEVDMTFVNRWRRLHQAPFEKREGFRLGITPFFLEAAAQTISKFPYVNCSVEGRKIVLKRHVNLGCAVALGDKEKGFSLIVPVLQKAETKDLVTIARELEDLSRRARGKKLLPEEVLGGTFTVTNPGVFGTLLSTPVINQPQVAILGIGSIEKRPVIIEDMIAVREMCYLTLSYDHRIIDGALAGTFLAAVRSHLENWDPERPL